MNPCHFMLLMQNQFALGLLNILFRTRNSFVNLNLNTKIPFSTKTVILEIKNELIIKKYPFIRLIDGLSGKLLEPTRSSEILKQKPDNYDLVLVDGRQDPPIVKFQSHSQAFKLALKREEAASRARLANKLKEIHLSTVTGEHDFLIKINRVDDWIRKGWRVKVVIEEKKKRKSTSSARLVHPVDSKKEMMTQVTNKLSGIAEIIGTPELERGCLIFSLHGNQKIMSQLKQEREKSN